MKVCKHDGRQWYRTWCKVTGKSNRARVHDASVAETAHCGVQTKSGAT